MNKKMFSPEHEVAADLTQSGNSVARAVLGHTPRIFVQQLHAAVTSSPAAKLRYSRSTS